jgi:hypothetical protein
VTGPATQKLSLEGVSEFYLLPDSIPALEDRLYRPAVLIDCSINFRSLRAGLNHSDERSYAAWLPSRDLAIDWDQPAAIISNAAQLLASPDSRIGFVQGNYQASNADLDQYEAELIDKLVRNERLRIVFNPVFGMFSSPDEGLEDFLGRVAEAALGRVEPELKRLRSRFELQLEQVREARSERGISDDGPGLDRIILHNLRFFESENRLAAMFSSLAGSVFGATGPRSEAEIDAQTESELREDLDRVEQEASDALRALYGEYMSLSNEYDMFEIGLQPDNIQVIRRALLWVPVNASDS